MAVLQRNETKVPFWGKKLSFVKGLDPLGLQVASVAAYTLLLPGLNNVTDRIRYYGFYSWLLGEYARIAEIPGKENQYQFIRRAELCIAILAQFKKPIPGGIAGNNYAAALLRNERGNNFNLNAGADKKNGSTEGTYWKYGSGAFGQYYLGALRDIGLITEREKESGVYFRTSSTEKGRVTGKQLAEAFSSNIPEDVKAAFLQSIQNGLLLTDTQDFDLLVEYFDLGHVPEGTSEQILYWNLLTDSDFPIIGEANPTFFRRQTITHLMEFIDQSSKIESVRHFTHYAYKTKGKVKGEQDNCLTGWFFYQLNEYWQYACLGILNGTLEYLKTENGVYWVSLSDFLNDLSQSIYLVLEKYGCAKKESESLEEVLSRLIKLEDEAEWIKKIDDAKLDVRAAYSFLLIWRLLLGNQVHLVRLQNYAHEKGVFRDGDGVSYLLQLDNRRQEPIGKFLKEFLYVLIIQRHQMVAFRKMGGGSQSTQKFVLEDNHIRYIGSFEPRFTGPRVETVIDYLKDLHYLNEDGTLSDGGTEKLLEIL